MKNQPYKTLLNYNESELKEKKSIFIGKAYPVSNQDEVKNILNELKKKYYDASHHSYAYRLLSEKSKFSDAGEPSGTAGIKILNAIDHYNLHDCLVVVIRYFGGTKLGIGPLGKSYYEAAIQVLSESNIQIKKPYKQMDLKIAVSFYDKLNRTLNSNKIIVIDTIFDAEAKIKCLFPFEIEEKIKTEIMSLFSGKVIISIEDNVFYK